MDSYEYFFARGYIYFFSSTGRTLIYLYIFEYIFNGQRIIKDELFRNILKDLFQNFFKAKQNNEHGFLRNFKKHFLRTIWRFLLRLQGHLGHLMTIFQIYFSIDHIKVAILRLVLSMAHRPLKVIF